MSETAGMTLISTIVKKINGFDSANVKVAEWGILNSGAARVYAIIRPGPATRPRASFGVRENNYQTVIEVWYRFIDDGSSVTGLLGYVDLVAAEVDKYPELGDATGTIRRSAEAAGLGEMSEQWRENGDGPSWLKRDVMVNWTQESEVTYAE